MKPRELCESAWKEIANNFLDFKATKKGQNLKKFLRIKILFLKLVFNLINTIILLVLDCTGPKKLDKFNLTYQ